MASNQKHSLINDLIEIYSSSSSSSSYNFWNSIYYKNLKKKVVANLELYQIYYRDLKMIIPWLQLDNTCKSKINKFLDIVRYISKDVSESDLMQNINAS